MKALTIYPEYAHAVAYLDKRHENRSWPVPAGTVGQRIAIHAGKHIGGRPGWPAAARGLRDMVVAAKDAQGILCDYRADHFPYQLPQVRRPGGPWIEVHTSAIVATAVLGAPIRNEGQQPPPWADPKSRWWWPLLDVEVLPTPILGVRGAQGLWTLPGDAAAMLGAK